MGCPHCSSEKIVRNGHHYGGKLHFLCNTCHKHFTIDVLKGYPITKIPYPIIAYLLYFRRNIPSFANMRAFRRFVSQWLECLDIRTQDISRQTIHHWIHHYEKDLENTISFQEARDYVKTILSKKKASLPSDIVAKLVIPHTTALQIIVESFGHRFSTELARKNKSLFIELTDIISNYRIYCWKRSDREETRRDPRFFFQGLRKTGGGI